MLTLICLVHTQKTTWHGSIVWKGLSTPPIDTPGMLFIWYVSIGISFSYFEFRVGLCLPKKFSAFIWIRNINIISSMKTVLNVSDIYPQL